MKKAFFLTVVILVSLATSLGFGASDDFNRASLGTNWGDSYSATATIDILSSSTAYAPTDYTDSLNAYVGASFTADQISQMTLSYFTSSEGAIWAGVGVRIAASPTWTGYFCAAKQAGSDTTRLYRVIDGVWTTLDTENTTTWLANDTIQLRVVGNQLTCYRNGNPLLTANDGDISSGAPGIYLFRDNTSPSDVQVDDWLGSNIGANLRHKFLLQ